MTPLLLLPLLAAFLYALSSLFLKRGFAEGAGFLRILFLSNLVMGAAAPVLLLLGADPVDWGRIHLPLACGAFFFLGQTFTFVAIRTGDVSVVTPTMGSKVVFVALIAALAFGEEIPPAGWAAVLLAGLAVLLLGLTRSVSGSRREVLAAIAWAAVSCGFFAASDNLVAAWAPGFGKGAFVAVVFLTVALASFALVPFFREPLRAMPRRAWFWAGWGAVLLAAQAALFNVALTYGEATAANILYSSRGLWAVALVAVAGGLFGNREGALPHWMIASRLAGSVFILVAIYLLLAA